MLKLTDTSKRINPWLIAGYAALAIPAGLLLIWFIYGWNVMLTTGPNDTSPWQFFSVLYAMLGSVALAFAALFGIVAFFMEEKHQDVYRWWRNKVENYGKIED